MIVIGERINGMFNDVKNAIKNENREVIQKLALAQIEAGANVLDVNVGPASAKPELTMPWLVKAIQEVTDIQLSLDSPKLDVIKAGMEAIKTPPIINSTQADPQKMQTYFSLVNETGASIIALTVDKQGVPQDIDRRMELASIIVMSAMENGIPFDRLFIDPIILPVNVAQPQSGFVLKALAQFQYLSDPPPHFVVGLSNVSQGTTEKKLINRTFLVMGIAMGLDSAIMDPFDKELMDAMITAEVLMNKQIYSDSFLTSYRSK
jgi:5-methyltetrahydrofolate corrinoid/iron sulfur protein methyltransferase